MAWEERETHTLCTLIWLEKGNLEFTSTARLRGITPPLCLRDFVIPSGELRYTPAGSKTMVGVMGVSLRELSCSYEMKTDLRCLYSVKLCTH
jgi:hypothetical protein